MDKKATLSQQDIMYILDETYKKNTKWGTIN